jgi:hypothetical protein
MTNEHLIKKLYKLSEQPLYHISNQSTEGAEFVWVSECQTGEGCEIMNQFVFVECHQCFSAFK